MNNRILVTGCSGFLGGRVAKHFASLAEGYKVVAASRRSNRKEELESINCAFKAGDLLDREYCHDVTSGTDYVVHCAALSSPWGSYDDFYQANVEATRNILEASVNNRVSKFIFISTPSIYFNFRDRFLVKESDRLPDKPVNHYAATKLLAEQHVLGSNGKGIKTLALRPRAIIGAGDTVIFPRLLRAYHSGGLKIIGKGVNRCDLTCVGNVITAIDCSFKAGDEAFGRAFNISDGNPVMLWEMINHLLSELELKPVTKKVPESVAYFVARLVEMKHKVLRDTSEPALTRYGLGALSKSLTMDISSARQYLKYQPKQTTKEGINEFLEWYRLEK